MNTLADVWSRLESKEQSAPLSPSNRSRFPDVVAKQMVTDRPRTNASRPGLGYPGLRLRRSRPPWALALVEHLDCSNQGRWWSGVPAQP